MPTEPVEAARIDGASEWTVTRYVTFPLLRPMMLFVLLLRVVDAFKFFDEVYVLTGGGPLGATESISIYIYRTAFLYWHMGLGSALAYILMAITVIMTYALMRTIASRSR
jgi:multiple sugar transport system permease protein